MSMRTTGSMNIECVAKPFKHNVLRKDMNRLSDEKGNVLFRCAQNLKHLMKAKMQVNRNGDKSVLARAGI